MTILQDVKTVCGVNPDNLGFDQELLLLINMNVATLVQLGIAEFQSAQIDEETEWPAFSNGELGNLIKGWLGLKVKQLFDPIPSEAIARAFENSSVVIEGRIAHEQAEVDNA